MEKSYLLYRMNSPLYNYTSSYILDITKKDNIESHFYYLIMKKDYKYDISRVSSIYSLLLFLQESKNDLDTCDFIETNLIIKEVIKSIIDGKVTSNGKNICSGISSMSNCSYSLLLDLLKKDYKTDGKHK